MMDGEGRLGRVWLKTCAASEEKDTDRDDTVSRKRCNYAPESGTVPVEAVVLILAGKVCLFSALGSTYRKQRSVFTST